MKLCTQLEVACVQMYNVAGVFVLGLVARGRPRKRAAKPQGLKCAAKPRPHSSRDFEFSSSFRGSSAVHQTLTKPPATQAKLKYGASLYRAQYFSPVSDYAGKTDLSKGCCNLYSLFLDSIFSEP